MSSRYLTDRYLPDKAIDLIDQAGARIRLRTKTPGNDAREREERLQQRRREKDQAVAEENYERAAALRDEVAELERYGAATGGDGPAVPEVTAADIGVCRI